MNIPFIMTREGGRGGVYTHLWLLNMCFLSPNIVYLAFDDANDI